MRTDYADIFQDGAAVDRYEQVIYASDTYSSACSGRQRTYLRGLAQRSFPQRRAVQHDFASGTGRAVKLLHGVVRAAHAYDVSPAMLERARAAKVQADLHVIAPDGPPPVPVPTEAPALVTCFRLVLNVPDEVRDRAIAFAGSVLPDAESGLLVVENHGNRSSLRHLGARRHVGDPWFAELAHADVAALLGRHGFEIVEMRGFAICPPGAYRKSWLRPLAQRIDDLAARIPLLARWCTDVLYVARRTPRRHVASRKATP
jgi:SAM-dependent methyltransferase